MAVGSYGDSDSLAAIEVGLSPLSAAEIAADVRVLPIKTSIIHGQPVLPPDSPIHDIILGRFSDPVALPLREIYTDWRDFLIVDIIELKLILYRWISAKHRLHTVINELAGILQRSPEARIAIGVGAAELESFHRHIIEYLDLPNVTICVGGRSKRPFTTDTFYSDLEILSRYDDFIPTLIAHPEVVALAQEDPVVAHTMRYGGVFGVRPAPHLSRDDWYMTLYPKTGDERWTS